MGQRRAELLKGMLDMLILNIARILQKKSVTQITGLHTRVTRHLLYVAVLELRGTWNV